MKTPKDFYLPTIYHYRHKQESDLSWIKGMLSFIPESERPAICRQYERHFGTKSKNAGAVQHRRKQANSYLKNRAAEWRAKNGI